MRLALAVTNNKIADHFGHCDWRGFCDCAAFNW